MARAPLPKTFAQLVQRGGPEAFVRAAARAAARQAAQQERQFWLDTLERMKPAKADAVLHGLYIRALRRNLGLSQPVEVVRAQTRERVRRFRERHR